MGLVGYLVWRERGWRIRYFEEEFCHVSLWRVELPRNSHPDRTVQRALTTLRRHGVTRLLADDATLRWRDRRHWWSWHGGTSPLGKPLWGCVPSR